MITRTEIDGRMATVAFMSARFQPVAEADAELVKVRFDDGDVMFLVPVDTTPHLDYDPNQPRKPKGDPEGGQWTAEGGWRGAGTEEEEARRRRLGEHERGTSRGNDPEESSGAYARRNPSDDGRDRGAVASWEPDLDLAERIAAKGATPIGYVEYGPRGAEYFHEKISAAKTDSPFGAAVTVYPVEDYRGMRTFLSDDGLTGFALKDDDVVSVFKHPSGNQRRAVVSALELAVDQGGRRLDAFDTVLPELYDKAGFKAAARIKFSDQFAPADWDYGRFKKFNNGRPDVVFMAYDPDDRRPYKPGDGVLVDDYDEAVAIQKKRRKRLADYDPSQPRKPKGDPEGGQWTASGATGTDDEKEKLRKRIAEIEKEIDALQDEPATEENFHKMAKLEGDLMEAQVQLDLLAESTPNPTAELENKIADLDKRIHELEMHGKPTIAAHKLKEELLNERSILQGQLNEAKGIKPKTSAEALQEAKNRLASVENEIAEIEASIPAGMDPNKEDFDKLQNLKQERYDLANKIEKSEMISKALAPKPTPQEELAEVEAKIKAFEGKHHTTAPTEEEYQNANELFVRREKLRQEVRALTIPEHDNPIMRKAFTNIEHEEGLHALRSRSLNDPLPQVEENAIRDYTSSIHSEINDTLRHGQNHGEDHQKYVNHLITHLDSAFEKAEFPEDAILHRGVEHSVFDMLAEHEGGVYVDKGFGSTTYNDSVARNWKDRVVLVKVRKGAKAMFLGELSNHEEEDEVLIARNASYKVTKDRKFGLMLELLPPPTKVDPLQGTLFDAERDNLDDPETRKRIKEEIERKRQKSPPNRFVWHEGDLQPVEDK